MKNEKLRTKNFNSLLRPEFCILSSTFWAPKEIIETSIDWLELNEKSKILDIGSGVGKFCVEGARISDASFTGVEIRKNLIEEANRIAQGLELKNVQFIHSDIKDVDFSAYDSFFYYNPFCEHLAIDEVIDDSLEFSRENHRMYEDVVFEKLEKMPPGTKVVTYNSREFILPGSYRMVKMSKEGSLVLWGKE
ncbi:MAG: class I SAM-dependent methyltransferase [Fluviicola sp.]|nr:class I SAM-dependent methyltransferase [Fluviicola sp.]